MAAAATDKFRKVSRRWVGQIGAGGVADASTTTVPLSSATNLATDTGVTVVIDRVDADGTATPDLEETVVGVVSGSNLISCVRGIEGTAQAHSAGAVVEVLVTADGYNDVVDGILVGHNQDGSHASSLTFTTPTLTSPVVQGNVDGWTLSTDTWVYASASTFTISGVDRTTIYTKGTRLKFTQTSAKYATVVGSSFSTNTTVTIAVNTDYTIANAAITAPAYSYQDSPQGYPAIFSYTTTWGGFSVAPAETTFRYSILGNLCTLFPPGAEGTSNATTMTFTLPIAALTTNELAALTQVKDNGAMVASIPGHIKVTAASATANAYKAWYQTAWTNTSTKGFYAQPFVYDF